MKWFVLGMMLMIPLAASPGFAQGVPTGTWHGSIAVQGIDLEIRVHFTGSDEARQATIDIPQQGALGLPLQNVRATPSQIYFELPAGPGLAVFDGRREGPTRIAGTFTQSGAQGRFTLNAVAASVPNTPPPPPAEAPFERLTLETATGQLHGTVLTPGGAAPYPVALLIAGSGPTDRDGNSAIAGANNSLKMMAEALAADGWASVRYDKRGVGESMPAMVSEAELRFTTYVDDATAWIDHLQVDPRFSRVVVVGHSEGSLIGMLAAGRAEADGFVSVAGPGRPAAEVLRGQLQGQLPPDLMQRSLDLIRAIGAGRRIPEDQVPQLLMALFRPSIQPYLTSWFAYDPADELARLTLPTLIVQGTTDIQVSADDARLLAAAQPEARLDLISGMNHILKRVSADPLQQQQSYSNPELPLHPALMPAVLDFLRSVVP